VGAVLNHPVRFHWTGLPGRLIYKPSKATRRLREFFDERRQRKR
jgi:hypothetical protein